MSPIAQSGHGSCLPPNEPPVGGWMTRTRSGGRPRTPAHISLLPVRLVVPANNRDAFRFVHVPEHGVALDRGVCEKRRGKVRLDDDVRSRQYGGPHPP